MVGLPDDPGHGPWEKGDSQRKIAMGGQKKQREVPEEEGEKKGVPLVDMPSKESIRNQVAEGNGEGGNNTCEDQETGKKKSLFVRAAV